VRAAGELGGLEKVQGDPALLAKCAEGMRAEDKLNLGMHQESHKKLDLLVRQMSFSEEQRQQEAQRMEAQNEQMRAQLVFFQNAMAAMQQQQQQMFIMSQMFKVPACPAPAPHALPAPPRAPTAPRLPAPQQSPNCGSGKDADRATIIKRRRLGTLFGQDEPSQSVWANPQQHPEWRAFIDYFLSLVAPDPYAEAGPQGWGDASGRPRIPWMCFTLLPNTQHQARLVPPPVPIGHVSSLRPY
jgi:hypothetical protein